MCSRYRFWLLTPDGKVSVNPIWDESTDKVFERQEGQWFFRENISAEWILMRDEFDLVNDVEFGFQFGWHIDRKDSNGDWQNDWWVGKFWHTDCSFDEDNRKVEFKCEVDDRYALILDQMQKEFNLIELRPRPIKIQSIRRPIVQVHIRFTNYVTNIIEGAQSWEEAMTGAVTFPAFTVDQGWTFARHRGRIVGENLVPDVSGDYLSLDPLGLALPESTDGRYEFDSAFFMGEDRVVIRDTQDNNRIVYYSDSSDTNEDDFTVFALDRAIYRSVDDPSSECKYYGFSFYGRVITNSEEVNGVPTEEIPEGDVLPISENYQRFLRVDFTGLFQVSNRSQTEPTRWGQIADGSIEKEGEYFLPGQLDALPGESGQPVLQSKWSAVSVWMFFTPVFKNILRSDAFVYKFIGYKLADVLKVLCAAIDPQILHGESADYSEFLYTANTSFREVLTTVAISPKSNILEGEGATPAAKAMIKLGEIDELLRNFYQAHWYIDNYNRFRIEYVDYFYRGGTYDGFLVGADLTELLEPKHQKRWGYKSKQWTYAKDDLPTQYTHRWMDEVSNIFEGFPLEVLSRYVKKDHFVELSLSRFTSDIDYIHAQPSDINREGFAFLELVEGDEPYEIPVVGLTIEGIVYSVLNGYCSMSWAYDKYWRRHLPGLDVVINLQQTQAESMMRLRVQEEQYPSIENPNPMQLIETDLGAGEVRGMRFNLSTGKVDVNLRHGVV